MTTNYDQIAEQYRQSKHVPWREWIERFTLLELVGDLEGRSVVDFACGEGYYTRLVRLRGAGRVLGVDLSPGMIELARRQEATNPLGIEYRVADAREALSNEQFDIAVAAYLLNYAHDRDELVAMCEAVASSLRPGGRFVTVNCNPAMDFSTAPSYRKYGFEARSEIRAEGAPITWTFHVPGGPIQVENYHLDVATHEDALRGAGFRDVRWHVPRLAPEHRDQHDAMATFLDQSPITFIECVKSA
ncbi:MAG: methyltransferase domain-containing protein [Pirellulales bacterium]